MRSWAGRKRGTTLLAAAALLGTGALAACGSSSSSESSSPSSSPTEPSSSATSSAPLLPPTKLTFGVVGSPGEIEQYRTMADSYVSAARKVTVKVESWPDDSAMLASFKAGERVPDVFLASRRHLTFLVQHHLIQPVDQLLDDRGFDFGDEYPRSSLTAFANDNRLQCLPYDIQPSVIFYNTRLVRFDQMRNDPPSAGQGWTLDQFAQAGRWAVRHNPGVAGIDLDPTLFGLAPFVYSGGGDPFDDDTSPTSLALSDEPNVDSLTQTVRALKEPGSDLSEQRAETRSPLEWFARGKLAMIEGSSRMVPDLRASGIRFDVMPMPRLDSSSTVGSLTGMCLSANPRDVATAADFLVYANTQGALSLVSYGGYLQPANQSVALSDAFQQPGLQPHHASVFSFSVKSLEYPRSCRTPTKLDLAVNPLLDRMLRGTPQEVPRMTRKIDRTSYRVLGPRFGPTAGPSQSSD